MPPNIRLVLADVDAGSDTPSLVGKVLKWRKENPESGMCRTQAYITTPMLISVASPANTLWSDLKASNQLVESQLRSLSRLAEDNPEDYRSAIQAASRRATTGAGITSDGSSLALQKLSESLQVSGLEKHHVTSLTLCRIGCPQTHEADG